MPTVTLTAKSALALPAREGGARAPRRFTLGPADEISLADARERALEIRAHLALLTSRSGSQLLEVVPQIFDEAAALLVPTPAVGVLSVW